MAKNRVSQSGSAASNKRRTRSRTGCLRCKERRVKCDETQPSCGQCQRRNLTCPGYHPVVRWSNQHEGAGNHQPRLSNSERTNLNRASRPELSRNTPPEESLERTPKAHDDSTVRHAALAATYQEVDMNVPILVRNTPEAEVPDLSNNYAYEFDNTLGASLVTDGSGLTTAALSHFSPIDHEFWGALTLPWSPIELGCANLPASVLISQMDTSIADGVSSGDQSERQPQSFDASEVTNEETQLLLQHYFDKILSLNSVFDSNDNPFRYLVSGYVKSSPLIRNCILSCSAMHLSVNNRDMHRRTVRYHSEALKYLAAAVDQLENTALPAETSSAERPGTLLAYVDRLQEALLALLLLYNSSSWLDPSNIGISHVLSARKLFVKWTKVVNESPETPRTVMQARNTSFIIGAMAYCEATCSFVFDQPIDAVDYLAPFCHQGDTSKVYPNPWTGVSTPIFISVARVGIYVRQKRAISKLQSLGWPQSIYQTVSEELLRRAAVTESLALEYEPPSENQIVSDQVLPPSSFKELETMAYTYKLATILELYRSFPELARRNDNVSSPSIQRPPSLSSVVPAPFRPDRGVTHEMSTLCQEDHQVSYELAISLLTLLEETAEGQATSLAHTLALIIGGSALHRWAADSLPVTSQGGQGEPSGTKVSNLLTKLNMRPQVVEKWRSFVRRRLGSNANFVGLESFRRTQTLMEEVWSRMDNIKSAQAAEEATSEVAYEPKSDIFTSSSTHWLDIMTECRLETVFG